MPYKIQKSKSIDIIDEETEYTIGFSSDDEYRTVRMCATTGPVPEVIYIPFDCLNHVIEALKEYQVYESPNF